MARTVAELVNRLNDQPFANRKIPKLYLMTDSKRLADPRAHIARMPKGSALIVRGFSSYEKEKIILNNNSLCIKHKVSLLVSDDLNLAIKYHLDGVHLSEKKLMRYRNGSPHVRRPWKNFIVTAACHSPKALRLAARLKVDAAFYSPVFKTASHPQANPVGRFRFIQARHQTAVRLIALGGITLKTARQIHKHAYGFAGISGLL